MDKTKKFVIKELKNKNYHKINNEIYDTLTQAVRVYSKLKEQNPNKIYRIVIM